MSRIRKPITAPYQRTRLETHLDEIESLRQTAEELADELTDAEQMIKELTEELRAERQANHTNHRSVQCS